MKNPLNFFSLIRFAVRALLSTTALLIFTLSASAQTVRLSNCSKIMPLGDSITLGVNGGYRNNLYTALQEENCGVTYVGTLYDQYTRVADKHHEGHAGFSIGNIADNVNSWLGTTQPNIVTLMIGTNDIAWWTADSAEQIGARHNALIDQIQKARPDIWIFVASIPPETSQIIQPNNIDRATLATQFNAVVRRNAEARAAAGQKVRFVDVNSVLTTADLYDGIHPTEDAHARIAQKFVDAIRATLAASTTSSTTPDPAPTPATPAPIPTPTPVSSPTPTPTPVSSSTSDAATSPVTLPAATDPSALPASATTSVTETATVTPHTSGGGALGLTLCFTLIGLVALRSRG